MGVSHRVLALMHDNTLLVVEDEEGFTMRSSMVRHDLSKAMYSDR